MNKSTPLILLLMTFVFLTFSVTLLASDINLDVKETTLSNGMKVIVLENHDAPVFSTIIRAKVGSVDEKSGYTGISHFLEHMMFKGTQKFGTKDYNAESALIKKIDSLGVLLKEEWAKLHDEWTPLDSTLYKKYREEIAAVQKEQAEYIIKDELWETYLKNGGAGLNASTGQDGTQYYVSLPSNRLELWALMESDRFANAVFREFYSERDVVHEERRMRTDNSPRGKMGEVLGSTAFTASGYHHPVVGWETDIENYDHPTLRWYYETYYAPNNLVAVVVGDVDANEVFEVCERYFGKTPRGPEVPVMHTREPEQTGEKRSVVEYEANPSVMIGWHCPAIGNPDNAALDVLTSVLSSGRTSRFNKTIVEEKKLANRAYIWTSNSRFPDLLVASAIPMSPHTCAEVEEAIYEEIEKLKTEPVTEWELQKIRNQLEAGFIRGLNSNGGMAWRLCSYQAMTGDWRNLLAYHEQIKAVTADDVMRVARKYFVPEKRTVVTLVKKEKAPEELTQSDEMKSRHQ